MNAISPTVFQFLDELRREGIRLKAEGGLLHYAPRSAVGPALLERLAAYKPELLAALGSEPVQPPTADPTEFYFANMREEDRRYVNPSLFGSATSVPRPCPWCQGLLVHHPLCDELRAGWEATVPFGRLKGRRLSEVSTSDLRWYRSTCRDDDFRSHVQEELDRRAKKDTCAGGKYV